MSTTSKSPPASSASISNEHLLSVISSITNDLPTSDSHSASGSQFQISISSTNSVSSNDIARYLNNQPELLTDETKFLPITNRIPHENFIFPSRMYKDKQRQSGVIHRRCIIELFNTCDLITYSASKNALFCLGCLLFPNTSHRRQKKLISEPYFNWKDARDDMKPHSVCDYHLSSMAQLHTFLKTHTDPKRRIDVRIRTTGEERIEINRTKLASIIKTLILCDRQGISLRGHRDDVTCRNNSLNMGNFEGLLDFRASAADELLKEHLVS